MTDGRVDHRYAAALFELAEEYQADEDWGRALTDIARTFQDSPELQEALLNNRLPLEEKKALVKQLFAQDTPQMVMNFLNLVLDKGRQEHLPGMAECYRRMEDEKAGLVEVKVTSPVPLDGEGQDRLAEQISRSLKAPVRLSVSVDKSLIGGIVLKIGDKLYDGSIKHRLALLQKAIEG